MKSIRQRLTRDLLGATLLLGGAGIFALYFAARKAAIRQFDSSLNAKALAISAMTQAGTNGVQVLFNDHFFRGFGDRNARDFFELWDASGAPIARSESLGHGDVPQKPPDNPTAKRWYLTLPNGKPGRAQQSDFQPGPDEAPATGPRLHLTVASDCTMLDETLFWLISMASGSFVLLAAATLWVIPGVLKRGLKPLDLMGEKAAGIDSSSLSTRFDAAALPAELRPIAKRLNELLARIQESFERERRFSADLAHELRTPLAELRSTMEIALKWPEIRDQATDQEILAIAGQMETMVTHMLALARGEQRQIAVNRDSVSLDALARDIWKGVEAKAAGRGIETSILLDTAAAEADAALLRAILVNLLDNAADHCSEGGRINLSSGAGEGLAWVRVGNSTDNVAPADLPRLFERFWRKEEARTGGTHVGLGLALSRNFAEAMGWTLTASMPRSGWLELTLSGPASARPAAVKSLPGVRASGPRH